MGGNIARRLIRGDHQVVVFDQDADAVQAIAGEGAVAAASLEDAVAKLDAPRAFWVMLPAGDPTEATIRELIELGQADDVVIDGGNSFYRDDLRRSESCFTKGLH